MAKYRRSSTPLVRIPADGVAISGRHIRSRFSLPIFAFFASVAFVAVIFVNPTVNAYGVESVATGVRKTLPTQTMDVEGAYSNSIARDAYTVTRLAPPKPVAPAAGVPDPGSAQAIAYEMVKARGWGDDEYSCLVALWKKESGWNVYAHNASSGAYGIPQALPGTKMATAGADWATNAATQITWGLGYIQGRYGTPCGAWGMSQSRGWY